MLMTEYWASDSSGSRDSQRRRRRSREQLQEENLWLAQQLAVSDTNTRQLEHRVQQLKRRVRTLETQLHAKDAEWAAALEEKEAKWMREYDEHMQGLLRVIAHHETTRQQLREEIEELRRPQDKACGTTERMTAEMETQTEDLCDGRCQKTQTPSESSRTSSRRSSYHHWDGDDPRSEQDEIQEHYVVLTMQKLLQQLQLSNRANPELHPSSASSRSDETSSSHSQSTSFRDSVLRRLSKQRVSSPQVCPRVTIPCQVQANESPPDDESSQTHHQVLMEQNQLLQRRLESQQRVLDRLLASKQLESIPESDSDEENPRPMSPPAA
ncbi:hypothetical protein Poli38472_012430 [Pythium oligandrum]|uniref:Uncharacterized protein n=1 Tax=Pythium oligandrum TaxID=41045 RepID=A0A8K1CPN5_PYTOL|nr:hypothetical protein Poli38472_012430 [Pythium oligandrum]|eukprot:TMW67314.1 hypothetical protein Poli38472_012430 [Pythium oligandrum]